VQKDHIVPCSCYNGGGKGSQKRENGTGAPQGFQGYCYSPSRKPFSGKGSSAHCVVGLDQGDGAGREYFFQLVRKSPGFPVQGITCILQHGKSRNSEMPPGKIEAEGCLEGGEGHLIHSERPEKGIIPQPVDDILLSRQAPDLGPAEHFVSRERHQVHSLFEARRDRGLPLQAEGSHVDKSAASEVFQKKKPLLFSKAGKLLPRNRGGKTLHPEIRRVDLQKGCRVFRHRVPVIPQVGPVRGSHLHEAGARKSHYVGNAEGPSDFHEFPPGDDHFFSGAQSGQHEQNRAGVIVHHESGLRTGNFL